MSDTFTLELDQSRVFDQDSQLVMAAKYNPAEFRQLYLKYLKRVYRYFYFRVGSVKDAEDLTSQVFLKVYEDLPRYRDQGCFSGWLFSIAHSRAVDFYRKGHREIPLDEFDGPADAPDLLAQYARSDEIQQVLALIRGLPEDDQELIRLRFMAGLNYREIGLALNRSEDAVRKAVTRLLGRLQTRLEVQND